MLPRSTPGDSTWFTEARFGMFIHWGIYAVGARHEWLQQLERISPDDYERRYFAVFDPDLYDPEAWADAAAGAGMRYMVITSKHHDGFCLWDSALTDYKAPASPAGGDLLRPMLDAFRGRGLRTGLYHSLIDWHHPDFTVDSLHPLRREPDRAALNEGRDMERYRRYLHGQVRELLTDYGQIDILWADFTYDYASDPQYKDLSPRARRAMGFGPDEEIIGKSPDDWDSKGLLAMIRSLSPDILVNDRLGLDDGWDITTPEQYVPDVWPIVHGEPALWESCQTFSGAWGYHRDQDTWKSVDQLVVMLIDVVSKGGNLLLNVGPTGRGEFDARVLDRLSGIGAWMRSHSRSIYGCTQAPDDLLGFASRDSRLTYNRETNRLYIHVLQWPSEAMKIDSELAERIVHAQLLNDASEIRLRTAHGGGATHDLRRAVRTLELPVTRPDVTVPVIELFLRS
jgi:alpha-L-fucosidase